MSQNPSNSLQFDSTKCSDSIAILSNHSDGSSSLNGSSAHQRASKVWGAVLSSTSFSPKTGIHRWAVRLDRCERGHVFVGVSTAQASIKTYVGGDKYGWGVIGTQALWHERRKVRGDYGGTFRTGSVIIVTLDTDAGTLSFSTWKDTGSTPSSYALDPIMPTISSPRRGGSVGSVEDWGVAFEGLPLDARLYPAVGLYQRDDRVTLLPVDSGKSRTGDDRMDIEAFAGGLGYYPISPAIDSTVALEQRVAIQQHNDALSAASANHVIETLHASMAAMEKGQFDDTALRSLPALASCVSLLPTGIPMLSQRFAVAVLPHVSRCLAVLDDSDQCKQPPVHRSMMNGKWLIRATGSSSSLANSTASSSEYEEYIVDFESNNESMQEAASGSQSSFSGKGVGTTGKSKNGLVSIVGTSVGTAVHFIEDWTDGTEKTSTTNANDEAGQSSSTPTPFSPVPATTATTSASSSSSSSCVIMARMNLRGSKFEGTYQNVQYGTTGHIAGVYCGDASVSTTTQTGGESEFMPHTSQRCTGPSGDHACFRQRSGSNKHGRPAFRLLCFGLDRTVYQCEGHPE